MKLSKMFGSMSVSSKAQPQAVVQQPKAKLPPMNFKQTAAYLATLTPAQLEHALERAKARATPDRIPLTIVAMAALHRSAKYNGETYTTLASHYDDAEAFVMNRTQVSNMQEAVANATPEALSDRHKAMLAKITRAPKKQVNWSAGVAEPKPSAEFLAKARRKAHS